MEEQRKKLGTYFQRFNIPNENADEYGDEFLLGECWEWKVPHEVTYWTVVIAPMTSNISFMTMYKDGIVNLPVTLNEAIREVTTGPDGLIFVCCKTIHPEQSEEYLFSYVVQTRTTEFSLSAYHKSLEPTKFKELQKRIEQSIDERRWVAKNGGPLVWKSLASRVNALIKEFEQFKISLENKAIRMQPLSLTRDYNSQGGSHGSLVLATPESGRSHTRKKTTERFSRGTPGTTPPPAPKMTKKGRGKKAEQESEEITNRPEESSMASELLNIPEDVGGHVKQIKYEQATKSYEEYWAACTDSYVGGIGSKFPISIDQLETPPASYNIRILEEAGVNKSINFFINMPDPDKKMTLCVMPQNLKEMPKKFEDIAQGKFWMVNGQHCVEASKRLQKMEEVPKAKSAKFRTWECFVVWNKDDKVIRKISAYYNRVNHFQNFMPTWATNIIGARPLWVKWGSPTPPKEPTELGKVVAQKGKSVKDLQNTKNYLDFKDDMKKRFAMIDTKRNQGLNFKKRERDIDIHNEIKIITASQEVFDLWSELISAHSQGQLVDPDSLQPFEKVKGWDAEKDGVISREFFKWLGNLSENDLKRLALHLLRRSPNREHSHPKVTMRMPRKVLQNCYTAKDWVERVKRKQAVRRQIHLLKPGLKLFDNDGNMRKDMWKKFKLDYNITWATKNTLLTAPGELFFSISKMPSSKNKVISNISPMAADFFKIFLETKGKFLKPEAQAFFRPYDMKFDELADWDREVWDENAAPDIKMAILDFRNIPGVINKNLTTDCQYYEGFLTLMDSLDDPSVQDPSMWLWICGERDVQIELRNFVRTSEYGKNYSIHFSEYVPAAFERIGDLPERSSKAKDPIQLLFLVRNGVSMKTRKIPKRFLAKSNSRHQKRRQTYEVEYRLYDTELRMEFYLKVLDLFVSRGEAVVSYFGGGKLICAAWMSSADHYVIGDSNHSKQFLSLCYESEILDKDDFLDSHYFLDDEKYARGAGNRASSSQKGKEPEDVDEDDTDRESDEEPAVNLAEDGAGDDGGWVDPLRDILGSDAVGGSTPIPESSVGGGSSGSSAHNRGDFQTPPTPVSGSSRRKRKAPVVQGGIPSKKQWIVDLINSNNEAQRQEIRQAREDTNNMMEKLMEKLPEVVSQTTANVVVALLSAKPLQISQPSGQSPPLLIGNQAQGSADSSKQARGISENVTVAQAARYQDRPSPSLAVNQVDCVAGDDVDVMDVNPVGDGGREATEEIPFAAMEAISIDALATGGEEAEQSQGPVAGCPPAASLGYSPFETPPKSMERLATDAIRTVDLQSVEPSIPEVHMVDICDVGGGDNAGNHLDLSCDSLNGTNRFPSAECREEAGSSGASIALVEALNKFCHPFTSEVSKRWLNVILDLNGTLCVCENASDIDLSDSSYFSVTIESSSFQAMRVAIRPRCKAFLQKLSDIAILSVWSSMEREKVLAVSNHLFDGIEPPMYVLGQEQCNIMKCLNDEGSIVNYKVHGSDKVLFLKPLQKLFRLDNSIFLVENTIVIDDCRATHVLNHSSNVILLDTWCYRGEGAFDDFLLENLLPYIQRLHLAGPMNLRSFRRDQTMGQVHLVHEPSGKDYDELEAAVEENNRIFDKWRENPYMTVLNV